MKKTYQVEYDGYYTMRSHDDEENALRRWFDNYKIEKHCYFATEYECLIVKEIPATGKNVKHRYVCEIIDEVRNTVRLAEMDYSAPPAPMLTFAAKRKYVPPPPKTPAELRKEEEWRRMTAMGYEPRRVPRRPKMLPFAGALSPDDLIAPITVEYDIEWVKRPEKPWAIRELMKPPWLTVAPQEPSPPKKHRRNV